LTDLVVLELVVKSPLGKFVSIVDKDRAKAIILPVCERDCFGMRQIAKYSHTNRWIPSWLSVSSHRLKAMIPKVRRQTGVVPHAVQEGVLYA